MKLADKISWLEEATEARVRETELYKDGKAVGVERRLINKFGEVGMEVRVVGPSNSETFEMLFDEVLVETFSPAVQDRLLDLVEGAKDG